MADDATGDGDNSGTVNETPPDENAENPDKTEDTEPTDAVSRTSRDDTESHKPDQGADSPESSEEDDEDDDDQQQPETVENETTEDDVTDCDEAVDADEKTEDQETNGENGDKAYSFSKIGDDYWPPKVEYTPKYDKHWVYTVGGQAAGSRDDVPVQGIELQVAAAAEEIEAVVRACMDGVSNYQASVGEAPRHMFIADAAAFESVGIDNTGTVAVFQPRADDGRSLVDHMTAFREGTTSSDDLTPNRDRAYELATHLQTALAAAGVGGDAVATYHEAGGSHRPVVSGRIYERYAALGAEGLYDPTDGPADMDSLGAEGTHALGFEPRYLNVNHPDEFGLGP
jgi:hypothetical protein